MTMDLEEVRMRPPRLFARFLSLRRGGGLIADARWLFTAVCIRPTSSAIALAVQRWPRSFGW
jgi:hypothetical protein